jgi:hypothetical protein
VVCFTSIKIAADGVRPMAQTVVNRVAAGEGFDLLNQECAKDGEKAHLAIINGNKLLSVRPESVEE